MKSIALLLIAAPAWGQAPDAARPDARVPGVRYESAFEGYKAHREPELAPWKEVNEDVAKAGGHIGIFRPSGPKPAPKDPPAKAPAPGHAGH